MTEAERREAFATAIVNPAAYDAAVEWIADNLNPQDVFDEEKLAAWALMRGWVKPEEEE